MRGFTAIPVRRFKRLEAKGGEVLSHFHEIGQLTQQVERGSKMNDLMSLGQALTTCHDHLRAVGSAVKKQTTWSPLPLKMGP